MTTETVIPVRYPETDPMGIVHHAVYPLWYEIARMDWCAAAGFPYVEMQRLGVNPAMVNLNVTYRAQVTYPSDATVRTWCKAFGPRKLELAYETVRSDGTVASTAVTFHIWTGPGNKTLDLSQAYPELYASFRAAAGADKETL